MGIWSIYVEDEYSNLQIKDVIKPEVREKSVNYLKQTFINIEKEFIGEVDHHNLKKAIEEISDRSYFKKISAIAEELIESILSYNGVLLGLVDIKNLDSYIYRHSVNVAVISLVMGIYKKYNRTQLLELALGALLHDIGKAFIPIEILKKINQLTEEEVEIYKSHTKKGYDYVKNNIYLKEGSTLVVLQHHERIDGLGYPNGLKGNEISEYSKIVSIANCYDYLTSDSIHSRAIPPSQALEFIMAHVNTLFDYELVGIFSKVILVYPKGTIVRLSTGEVATVESTPCNYPLRPTVKIIKSNYKDRIGKRISLLNQLSIVISKVEYNI